MLASPVAAIVLNHGLQRRAELASLSSSYSQYVIYSPCSPFEACSPTATVSNSLTTTGEIYQACHKCRRAILVLNLKQHMDKCGEPRLGFLVQLQPVRHTGPDGIVSVCFSATNVSCIWMQQEKREKER